jgi:hypothetical protein
MKIHQAEVRENRIHLVIFGSRSPYRSSTENVGVSELERCCFEKIGSSIRAGDPSIVQERTIQDPDAGFDESFDDDLRIGRNLKWLCYATN